MLNIVFYANCCAKGTVAYCCFHYLRTLSTYVANHPRIRISFKGELAAIVTCQ